MTNTVYPQQIFGANLLHRKPILSEMHARIARAKAEAPSWTVTKTELLYGGTDGDTGEYYDNSRDSFIYTFETPQGTFEMEEGCYCTCPDSGYRKSDDIPCIHEMAVNLDLVNCIVTREYCEVVPDYSCGEEW